MSLKIIKDGSLSKDESALAQKNYDEIEKKLNNQKYTSFLEERKRISKLFMSMKINRPVEEVYNAFLEISLEDLNPNLNPTNFTQDSWYKASKKNNNNVFKVQKLVSDKEICLTWVVKNQLFIKQVRFKSNKLNTKTKIIYFDYAKGDTSIMGFFERHILNAYLKKQSLAFRVQILKTKLKLKIYKPNKEQNINKKIDSLLHYIKNII
ncbi:hypothetical protein SLITO_v1c03080 [Spiroplasma litorale]|uniref:Uncharacterized protein n=1 Tax=Spiroplasma litorale TaxID=216942 RepID=A0A0K1W1B6_9MOLU|nr:hypothetical protein [Spiroplasma litorale]AKX33963.1 hypothetical protein SLITO_v1c03080 [Spiroplasma litorale]